MDAVFDRIATAVGDLVAEQVDAIVNAANGSLRGGGGVDGAIHRAAGPALLAECIERHPDGCPTGEARITGGHGLRARHVIHVAGPVWRGGTAGEPRLLASCHERALDLAAAHALRTLAFPAVSCGAYGYPPADAAAVAVAALARGLARHRTVERVRIVLFTPGLERVFAAELDRQRRAAAGGGGA